MDTLSADNEPLPGDYYGTIYKGSLIIPLIGIVLIVTAVILILKKRK